MLFIDSSHVVKAGSDVNHLVLDVLPRLPGGVHVHFHDVFHPFEYFPVWLERDRKAWSENYLLRALLAHSHRYQVQLFADYLWRFHKKTVKELFPAMLGSRPRQPVVRDQVSGPRSQVPGSINEGSRHFGLGPGVLGPGFLTPDT